MNQATKYLGFDDKWLVLAGIPVVTLLMNAMMFPGPLLNDFSLFISNCLFVGLVYTIVYWVTYRQLLIFSRKKIPAQMHYLHRVLLLVVMVVVVFFLLKLALDPLLHPLLTDVVGESREHELSMSIGSLLVTFMVLGIYETAWFYIQFQQSQLEKERLVKENVQSQLEGLKNQVNPHFFFNSLNTLAYLIPEDPAKAGSFVQKLSKAYRYILEIRDKELVSLAEELEFLDAYTGLLKERFGENLLISIQIPHEILQRKIVPLSLQMLFENAIKHNVVSTQHPLTIETFAENSNRLVVKNNLHRKKQEQPSTQIGLENIRRRYRFFTEKEVEVITTQQFFIVILPLIQFEPATTDAT